MKKLLLVLPLLFGIQSLMAQNINQPFQPALKSGLPPISQYIIATQNSLELYKQNMGDHSLEHDVNSIVKDIEAYLNALPAKKSESDILLNKEFNALHHFFLTTTNKTSVATSFLYPVNPYQFCNYHDTAIALYISAVNDGNAYNLTKTTEKKVFLTSLQQCLLPCLKAVDEFKDTDIKYIGLSVYLGCKDTRSGAPKDHLVTYCLTLVARLADLQQYAAGLITEKGLMANADIYISDGTENSGLNKLNLNIE